ncbi:class I SAM-dependent methyltransferase [Desulfovermiculus halophilus]|jgi:predicted nicotinamide N-methyase|uniref:class I SAM-dependent methyltransferase n=1 Tax=Desulfovermiculus halophilus TaxID=339722 RepID=UPI0004809E36|nr:methyltransferase [Desulfovermiculus halophilus]
MPTPTNPALSSGARLDDLLSLAKSKYPVEFETIGIGDVQLRVLQIKDMEAYIEQLAASSGTQDGLELPFWAKIWPTSMLLSHILSTCGVNGLNVLELGAGIGVCGMVAACMGARVTLTDCHPDALLFARINVMKNDLEDRIQLADVDFTTDRMPQRFERIIGSEILYRESTYSPLVQFLDSHLTPEGEILLAKSHIFRSQGFYALAEKTFNLQEKSLGYKETSPHSNEPERHVCRILRMTRK